MQRGNNRQATFYHNEDYAAYLEFLDEAATQHDIRIHTYVLMTNHVHLLLTPTTPNGLSLVMQSLGRRYVTYVNSSYGRTGTLWEGRFKGSVVDSSRYCLSCYRYIDLNPLRAGLVSDPADFRWSSFRANGRGEPDRLLTPHPTYLQLGATGRERAARYRALVEEGLNAEELQRIRYGSRKGLPVGGERFKLDIEHHLRRRLGSGRVGRPRKN